MPKHQDDFLKMVTTLGPHRVHMPTEAEDRANSTPLSVQEWTGQGWEIVEVLGAPGMAEPSPLAASSFPGQYVGQRVVTA
jgi:hypothetical protein